MIALFDFIPAFCPNCGAKMKLDDPMMKADYQHGASCSCDCGMGYQKATKASMLNAATESGGDMEKYHS